MSLQPNRLTGGADGLLYGGGFELVGVQTLSVIVAAAYAGLFTAGMFWVLKKWMGIRANEDDETTGLDLNAHGEIAYEYANVAMPVDGDADSSVSA